MAKKIFTDESLGTLIDEIKAFVNSVVSAYETKVDATAKLAEAKTYADNGLAQKSQVQIITWEDGD